MAIIELALPKVKPDQATIDEVERDWPILSKKITHPNPGLLSAFRGWILTEDGRDVRGEHKEILILEWNSSDSFHAFIVSEQFKNFAAAIRHLVSGPPTLQLFDANLSPKDAASAPSVEILRVTVSNPEAAEAALKTWAEISQKATEKYGDKVFVTYGKSQNLENEVVVGIVGWLKPEESIPATGGGVLVDLMDGLKALGETSHMTVDVDPMELSPL